MSARGSVGANDATRPGPSRRRARPCRSRSSARLVPQRSLRENRAGPVASVRAPRASSS
jgi:hypothetical protein